MTDPPAPEPPAQMAGHRTTEAHDCFLMNCKALGPEVEQLRALSNDEYRRGFADAHADNDPKPLWLAGVRAFLDELERDCSPLAQDPENSIDYGEGLCDERGRIAGILDSLLASP